MLSNLALAVSQQLGLNTATLLNTELINQAGLGPHLQAHETHTTDTFETETALSAQGSPSAARPLVPALMAGALATLTPTTALAQSPSFEALTSISPSLPPTWQMVVGGLLYAEPALRATSRVLQKIISWFSRSKPSDALPPAQQQTITGKLNQATGRMERVVGPIRDFAALGAGIYTGAQLLFGNETFSSHLPAVVAVGLSTWNYFDRTGRVEKTLLKNQLATGERLTPAGWRAQEAGALGVFAPDVPAHFPKDHLVGDTLPAYAQGAKPGFSLWRNIRALGTTVSMLTGIIRRSHVYEEGTWNTVKSWLTSIRPGRHAPVSNKYLSAVDIMLPQWVMRMSEHYGITLAFKGMEKLKALPKDAPVVFGAFPHSAIYTDFLFWHALPRARFVADKHNFHDAKVIRAIGLAWFLDVIGLPFVSRSKKTSSPVNSRTSMAPSAGNGNGHPQDNGNSVPPSANGNGTGSTLYAQTTDRMAKYGIQPVFFGQAGRAPRAYRDDRSLGRPGLYSNVVDPKRPGRYYNLLGTINTALAAAKQARQDAFIPILHIEGSGRVMPKISKNPPFIQPVQPGEVTFSIGDLIRVAPTATIAELTGQIIEAAKRATGINEFLQREVTRWAEQAGTPADAEAFARAAAANETYYIIADRIRSVHPNLPQRNVFKSRLLAIATRADQEQEVADELHNLLSDVSLLVKKTEYQSQ